MSVRKFSPVTPGLRFKVANSFSELTKDNSPERSLTAPLKKSGGRNNTGKMTMRYKGGGHKRRYRVIDFARDKDNVSATVSSIEYDPNRTAFIALLQYADGEKRYIIAPDKLKVGDVLLSGETAPIEIGNALPLNKIPSGTNIHSIELRPGKGASMARSAGTYATLVGKDGEFCSIKLPSGEIRKVLGICKATIGSTSNPDHSLEVSGKAGRSRWLGVRPRTRGVAMNPVDHPMGGGEGRASGGHPRSRNGQMAKGQKTRNPRKASSKYIVSKRKSK